MAALWDEVKNQLDKPGASIILMDEPYSALDLVSKGKIKVLIEKYGYARWQKDCARIAQI